MSKYIVGAILAIAIVFVSFFFNFYVELGYGVSNNSEKWGQFGDYIGGVLNPILSFISIVLLIESVSIQLEANKRLTEELKIGEKSEKLKTFETLFFNLISSQKDLFSSFRIDFKSVDQSMPKFGSEAVLLIETNIESIREKNTDDAAVRNYLETVDTNESIYGLTRAFYISVKLIQDKLNVDHGFKLEDRNSHLLTLINFTDFAQLRLILIGMQFLDYPSTRYLRNNVEFNSVLTEVKLGYDLY